ncbi:MAG: nucleotidyltransferase family protein [Terracidiphilus sp.]
MHASTLESGRTALRIPPEVRALLSALQLSKPDTTSLQKLSEEEWTSLLAFSNLAHLTLQIAQLPLMGFPHWVIERLKTNLADNTLRFERVKATYREAAEALKQAGVEHIVIKGFTQAPDYVADPRLRAQSDIDIFCPPKCIDAANGALRAIGYKPSDAEISFARADHGATLVRLGDWQWRGNPFDPEMPPSIELHFCLWNQHVSHIRVPDTDLFWERRTMREVEGLSFSCLSPVDHLGYLALHILRNLFLGDWIVHHVRELAVFLHSRADNETFWQTWNETHSPSLRSFEAIAFYYARAWFDCRLHPLAAHEIDRLPATRRSWLQCFAGSALEVMFEKNKDSLWLQLSFLSSRREKWKILRRTLIPARIASIDSPFVQVRNNRLLQSGDSPLWRQYISYLISRSAAHYRANIVTLTRGLRWRLSPYSHTLDMSMNGRMKE